MSSNRVKFSVAAHAAWAPGLTTTEAWRAWANGDATITDNHEEPPVKAMSPLLRRRASPPGKMALEVAYRCVGEQQNVPSIFCSRHGECGRSAELLADLARNLPLSPTAFSLSVHNATGGLFSIARRDHANQLALSAGPDTIEHAVIEACSLLADGEPAVLLVAYDDLPPSLFTEFNDCLEQAYAWGWLLQAPQQNSISLEWTTSEKNSSSSLNDEPVGLQVLRFFLRSDKSLERYSHNRCWRWSHHA